MPNHKQDGGSLPYSGLMFLANMDKEPLITTDLIDDGPFNFSGGNALHLYNYSGSNAAIITGPDGRPARSFTAGTNGSNTAVYQGYCAGAGGPPYCSMAMGCQALQTSNPSTNANILAWLAQDGIPVVQLNSTPAGGVYATMRSNTGSFYDTASVSIWPNANWWGVGVAWDLPTNTLSLLVEGVRGCGRLSVAATSVLPGGQVLYNNNTNYFQIHSNSAFGKMDGIAKVWSAYIYPRVLENSMGGSKEALAKSSNFRKTHVVRRRYYVGNLQKPAPAAASGYSLSSVVPLTATTLRVTMSAPVLHINPANVNDALNPHNYVITPGYPGVVSVTHVSSSSVFDITLPYETQAITYSLKIIDIQTSDGQQPNSDGNNDTKTFTGIANVPTITGVSVGDGYVDVAFSKAMNPSTINQAAFNITPTDGSAPVNIRTVTLLDGHIAHIFISRPTAGGNYSIAINAIPADLVGNHIVPTALAFVGGGALPAGLCFEGAAAANTSLLPVELWIATHAFSDPGLNLLRTTVLNSISGSTEVNAQVRTMLVNVYQTELKGMFTDLLTVPQNVVDSSLCLRRRNVDADKSLQAVAMLFPAIYRTLGAIGVPAPYQKLLEAHRTSPNFKNRVAAHCAIVLLAGTVLSGA